jgi:hypothetical protein
MNKQQLVTELVKIAKALAADSPEDVLTNESWLDTVNSLSVILEKINSNIKAKNLPAVKAGLRVLISDTTTALHDLGR